MDLYALPFRSEAFDHVFVCFVLEHLADLGEAEPRLVSQVLDEAQPFDVVGVVQTVVAAAACSGREETDLLVIANGPGGKAECGGHFLNLQERGRWCVVVEVARGVEVGHGLDKMIAYLPVYVKVRDGTISPRWAPISV